MAFDLKNLIRGKKEIHPDGVIRSMPVKMPETIDFSELWRDPVEGSMLQTILSYVTSFGVVILLIMKIMGH